MDARCCRSQSLLMTDGDLSSKAGPVHPAHSSAGKENQRLSSQHHPPTSYPSASLSQDQPLHHQEGRFWVQEMVGSSPLPMFLPAALQRSRRAALPGHGPGPSFLLHAIATLSSPSPSSQSSQEENQAHCWLSKYHLASPDDSYGFA